MDISFLLETAARTVVVFDLTTMNLATNPPTPPTVVASIPTGVSADYDGPLGIAGCIASWNGEAGSAADCGDDRSDEMWFDDAHKVLAVMNGDPGLPFVTFLDMSHIVGKTGTLAQQHCLPLDWPLAYGPYPVGYSAATGTYLYNVAGGLIPIHCKEQERGSPALELQAVELHCQSRYWTQASEDRLIPRAALLGRFTMTARAVRRREVSASIQTLRWTRLAGHSHAPIHRIRTYSVAYRAEPLMPQQAYPASACCRRVVPIQFPAITPRSSTTPTEHSATR